jgi:hypothetical protein
MMGKIIADASNHRSARITEEIKVYLTHFAMIQ